MLLPLAEAVHPRFLHQLVALVRAMRRIPMLSCLLSYSRGNLVYREPRGILKGGPHWRRPTTRSVQYTQDVKANMKVSSQHRSLKAESPVLLTLFPYKLASFHFSYTKSTASSQHSLHQALAQALIKHPLPLHSSSLLNIPSQGRNIFTIPLVDLAVDKYC